MDAVVQAARRDPAVHDRRPSRCPARSPARTTGSGERLARKEASLIDEQMICECELVPRRKLEEAITRTALDQPRRHPPPAAAGHGPVPGRLLHLPRHRDPARARRADAPSRPTSSLLDFLQERWKGVWPVLYGDQLRQVRLDDWIFQGVLDVEHLPTMRAERAALRRGRHRRRHRRAGRRRRGWPRTARACACWPRAWARRTWRRPRSTCSATRPTASTPPGRRWSSSSPPAPTTPTRCSAPRSSATR